MLANVFILVNSSCQISRGLGSISHKHSKPHTEWLLIRAVVDGFCTEGPLLLKLAAAVEASLDPVVASTASCFGNGR